ncbi:MAG: DUF3343 domain-containing protein [Nitrososphaerota archaeon]|nr:DUF3343 domain-containing protein [Candidatus Bathyarchaeota archaeon]MDW8024184.1 DUF3343 domain-containing protein [Nitrososphaerota archaeon]
MSADVENVEKALIILSDVREAIMAEEVLKRAKFEIKTVAPPPEVRIGCDLAIEFNVVDRLGVEQALERYGIKPLDIIPLKDPKLRPLDIVEETSFGDYLMVKAGHMKLTFNKRSGEIVNISGGGCPDVPYLALEIVGKKLGEAKSPRRLGYSLCAYMLDKAFTRALEIFKGEK